MRRARAPTADNVGEGARANVNVGAFYERAIAYVTVFTVPSCTVRLERSNDDMTIPCQSDRRIPSALLIGKAVA